MPKVIAVPLSRCRCECARRRRRWRSATIRAAAVGSCSSAVPTWTAIAPAARKLRASAAEVIPPAPTTWRAGQLGADLGHAAQRDGEDGGPAEPGLPAVGHRRGQRVADHDGVRTRVRGRCGRSRRRGPRRCGAWPAPGRHGAGRGGPRRRRSRRGRARARRTPRSCGASGEERLTSIAETPGDRPSRRASSAYSPSVLPAIETTTRVPCWASQGSSVARKPSRPGFCRPTAWTRPDGVSTMRGCGPPGRGLSVMERVTKPPRSASGPYAASSRPVPPQPEATSTGRPGSDRRARSSARLQLGPAHPVAAQHRSVAAGAGGPGDPVLPDDRDARSPGTGRWRRCSGRSRAVWLHAPWASAAAATACSVRHRAGRVDDLGGGAGQHVVDGVGDLPRRPTEPSRGHDGDRAGGAARLQAPRAGGPRRRRRPPGDGAAALAEPLGEREERRGGVPLADQDAADRLLGQGEGPAERAGDLEPGAAAPGGSARWCRGRRPRRPARARRRSRRPA